jgi:hypothetical protein
MEADHVPATERIMLQDLEDRQDSDRALSCDSKGFFAAPPEDAVDARRAKTVDDVGRQPERDVLGDVELLPCATKGWHKKRYQLVRPEGQTRGECKGQTLIESDTQVNMDELAIRLVDEDVRCMSISEPDEMSNDGRDGNAPSVREPRREPGHGVPELFPEDVPHDGFNLVLLEDGFEHPALVLLRACPSALSSVDLFLTGLDRDTDGAVVLGSVRIVSVREEVKDVPYNGVNDGSHSNSKKDIEGSMKTHLN